MSGNLNELYTIQGTMYSTISPKNIFERAISLFKSTKTPQVILRNGEFFTTVNKVYSVEHTGFETVLKELAVTKATEQAKMRKEDVYIFQDNKPICVINPIGGIRIA